MNCIRSYILVVVIATVAQGHLTAQVELVSADHEVYGFLKRMQVRGVLVDQYSTAYLPYDRETIAYLIDNIADRRERLSSAENAALQRYMVEFSYELGLPREERISLLSEGVQDLFDPRQKYLYRFEDETAVISANLLLGSEIQYWDIETIADNTTSLWQVGGGISGTIGGWFGFSLQAVNGFVGGSRELGKQNIEVDRTYKIEEPDSRFYDFTYGHVRAANSWGSVTIGRERLIGGNGPVRSTLLFSDYAPEIDYIGLNVQYNRFFFNFFHGWILGEEEFIFLDDDIRTRYLPDKYVSFHRIGAYFFNTRLQVAVSEMIVYGDRGIEIAYLNPFLFFKSVEHSLRDRDKALIALDIQLRPYRGVELYGDLLIDDIAFNKLGTNWYGNQYAFRMGGIVTPEFTGLRNAAIYFDYVRIQPYVYTHRIPLNSYEHAGFPIGNPAGPNSDAWMLRWNQLLSGRSSVELYYNSLRKGHNVTDADGNLIRNVGGNISQGFRSGDSEEVSFLDGNLEKTAFIGILFKYEVFHQFFLSAGYEFRSREEVWNEQTFQEHFMFGKLVMEL